MRAAINRSCNAIANALFILLPYSVSMLIILRSQVASFLGFATFSYHHQLTVCKDVVRLLIAPSIAKTLHSRERDNQSHPVAWISRGISNE